MTQNEWTEPSRTVKSKESSVEDSPNNLGFGTLSRLARNRTREKTLTRFDERIHSRSLDNVPASKVDYSSLHAVKTHVSTTVLDKLVQERGM